MTSTHRAEAERLLGQATDNDGDIVCDDSLTTTILAAAQVHATLAAGHDPIRALLATLAERWQEVADSYKPKGDEPDDDVAARYANYRLIYLRNIRDLREALDAGRIPCGLMTHAERANGDCGHVHTEEPGDVAW
jgi:hypothetical protein